MSRRRRGRPVHGVVLLDKPRGRSSNQSMQAVRALFDAQKAGHTGNLDPFATGLLPVCLGEATKTAAFMLDADKTYRARARLGEATTTGDPEGEIIQRQAVPEIDIAGITMALERFEGEIEQVPPMYSALKFEGRPLYEYARRGVTIERPARRVTIHELRVLSWHAPDFEFEVHCSKGTYVRTLAEDIAAALGSCGHLVDLRRLMVGGFEGLPMVSLDELAAAADAGRLDEHLLPVDAGLRHWPRVVLDEARAGAFSHGRPVHSHADAGPVRVYEEGGVLLGLGESEAGCVAPRRVFVRDA